MTDGTDRLVETVPTDMAEAAQEESRFNGELAIAAYLHELSKRQSQHLRHPMFANPALDILLTLFIAAEEELRPPLASVCAANNLDPADCDSLVKRLVENGLAEWDERNPISGIPIARISSDGCNRVRQLARSVSML